MATTVPRDLILDAIAAALGGIGNQALPDPTIYFASVQPQVVRQKHALFVPSQFPCFVIGGVIEAYTLTSNTGIYSKALTVAMTYCAESQTMDEDASKIIHDVELALSAHRLGGVCDDLQFVSTTVQASTNEEPLFFVDFVIIAKYRTTLAAPATRV